MIFFRGEWKRTKSKLDRYNAYVAQGAVEAAGSTAKLAEAVAALVVAGAGVFCSSRSGVSEPTPMSVPSLNLFALALVCLENWKELAYLACAFKRSRHPLVNIY